MRSEVAGGEAARCGNARRRLGVQQVGGGNAVVAGSASAPHRELGPVTRNLGLQGVRLADGFEQGGSRSSAADHPEDPALPDGGTLQLAPRVLGDLPVAEGPTIGAPPGDGGRELEVRLGGCGVRQLEGGQPVRFARVGYAVGDRPDARGGEGDPEVVAERRRSSRSGPCRRRRWRGASGSRPRRGVRRHRRASSATAGCYAPTARVTRARWRCAQFADQPGR